MTGRRPDGYHDLDTLVVFANVGDRLTISPGDSLCLEVTGPFAAATPAGPENLVMKVADELRRSQAVEAGATVRLEKYLPSGAGIGGGSADAAATLQGLNALWNAGLALPALADIGLRSGADIPICLHSSALLTSDAGNRTDLWETVPALPLVLVWPGRPVSTAAVFSALEDAANAPLAGFDLQQLDTVRSVAEFLRHTRNDLTQAAVGIEPAIAAALDALESQSGCLICRMSGSGSTCFGLFADATEADAAARAILRTNSGWWVHSVLAG